MRAAAPRQRQGLGEGSGRERGRDPGRLVPDRLPQGSPCPPGRVPCSSSPLCVLLSGTGGDGADAGTGLAGQARGGRRQTAGLLCLFSKSRPTWCLQQGPPSPGYALDFPAGPVGSAEAQAACWVGKVIPGESAMRPPYSMLLVRGEAVIRLGSWDPRSLAGSSKTL